MAPRKWRKNSQKSEEEEEGDRQLTKEQRDQKIKLFMQQFEKEAQEKIREMEKKLDQTLATLERAFKVEMLKMPTSLQQTIMKDLVNEQESKVGEVTIAIEAECPEIKPVRRKPSKKVQIGNDSSAPTPRLKRMLSVQSKTIIQNSAKTTTKSRSLADLSRATKRKETTPRMTQATPPLASRTRKSRVAKVTDLTVMASGTHLRSMGAGDGELPGTSQFGMAVATIPTSCGQTLCLSDDVRDEIDVQMLDDTAVTQMQKLMSLMDYLCSKAKVNQNP
ncbi:borealin-2 [Amia ocellicauda]|uniref:borealin-2 n=1 Tax=Amia ocellicauda TaxID=2972642 RepID=UPI0034642AD0